MNEMRGKGMINRFVYYKSKKFWGYLWLESDR